MSGKDDVTEQSLEQVAAPACRVGSRPGSLLGALSHRPWGGVGWGPPEVCTADGETEAQCREPSSRGCWGSSGRGGGGPVQRAVPRIALLSPQPGDRLPPGRAGVPGARSGPGGAAPPPLSAVAAARGVPGTAARPSALCAVHASLRSRASSTSHAAAASCPHTCLVLCERHRPAGNEELGVFEGVNEVIYLLCKFQKCVHPTRYLITI